VALLVLSYKFCADEKVYSNKYWCRLEQLTLKQLNAMESFLFLDIFQGRLPLVTPTWMKPPVPVVHTSSVPRPPVKSLVSTVPQDEAYKWLYGALQVVSTDWCTFETQVYAPTTGVTGQRNRAWTLYISRAHVVRRFRLTWRFVHQGMVRVELMVTHSLPEPGRIIPLYETSPVFQLFEIQLPRPLEDITVHKQQWLQLCTWLSRSRFFTLAPGAPLPKPPPAELWWQETLCSQNAHDLYYNTIDTA
jgi:hypothetical protein